MKDFIFTDFPLSQISLTDSYCLNAFKKEVDYLVSFDVDRLLAGFRETAGLSTKGKERYPGWENMLIGGHCVGHYVGAVSNAIKSYDCSEEDKNKLTDILNQLLDGFEECQNVIGTGFVFGAKLIDKNNIEIQFDNVEKNLTNIITQAWVPWYTMHKLIEGLLCAVQINSKALTIIEGLVHWIYGRLSKWDNETKNVVLGIEYGGMNDCLYSVYALTGNEKALYCAKIFDDEKLFEQISSAVSGDDVLSGRHANTTIPKFIGALNRYVVTGEERFLVYAKNFWNLVTSSHTYVNGGNSTWEHFGEDNNLYSKLSNCNCETCNSYNMLKLTKLLYMITGEKKYGDWYEHTFINSILSSQNPESGMTTYFQPMASGYFKVFSSPFESFWCCTGTGMENFTKLGESFYFCARGTDLVVNQYISSTLDLDLYGVKVIQKSMIPLQNYSLLEFDGAFYNNLLLRLPGWCCERPQIFINDEKYDYDVQNGFAFVSGPFRSGTRVKIVLPMQIDAHNLPDQKDAWAFSYGPVVLSALLGEHDGKTAINGVDVHVPQTAVIAKDFIPSQTDVITVKNISADDFIKNINKYLVRDVKDDNVLSFNLMGTDSKLKYVIHYSQYRKRYGLYFRFLSEDESLLLNQDNLSQTYINANKLDTVQPGYGQYENDDLHQMKEYANGSVGQTYRGTSRRAKEGGAFSYTMVVDARGTDLLFMVDPKDNGKSLKIHCDGKILFDEFIACEDLQKFKKIIVPFPKEVLDCARTIVYKENKLQIVEITVCSSDNKDSAALCEFMYTLKRG